MKMRLPVLLGLLCLAPVLTYGFDTIPLNTYLGKYCEFALDTTECLDIECLEALDWFTVDDEVPNFGLGEEFVYCRFKSNHFSREGGAVFSAELPFPKEAAVMKLGEDMPEWTSFGSLDPELFAFPQGWPYVFRFEFVDIRHVPMILRETPVVLRQQRKRGLALGMYLGFSFIIALISFVFYLYLRDKIFLLYSFFLASVSLAQAINYGVLRVTLYDADTFFGRNEVSIFVSLTVISSCLFVPRFLSYSWNHSVVNILFRLFLLSGILNLICGTMVDGSWVRIWTLVNSAGLSAFLLVFGLICFFRWRVKRANYFLVGWSFFLIGAIVYNLRDAGALEYNSFTTVAMTVGSAIEIVVFSISLAAYVREIHVQRQAQVFVIKEQEVELVKFRSLEQRMKQSDLRNRSLFATALMSPHFIFNALATVQSAMLHNDGTSSARILSRFAKLMRRTIDASRQEFVFLEDEIEMLNDYLKLEQEQSAKPFDFEIVVEDDIDRVDERVPSFLVQPIVENAIKHGVSKLRDRKGKIVVRIRKPAITHLMFEIEDNGVGRKLLASNSRPHKSVALDLIEERSRILADQGLFHLTSDYIDLWSMDGKPAGTKVVLTIRNLES